MPSPQTSEAEIEIVAENVGGIDEASLSLRPGVNVLEGRNASNRTSLLQAIMAALGSEQATLKGDADEGRAELTIDGETYDRQLVRRAEGVAFTGDPYLADTTVADLFAFLLETNEARQAVERGVDLRERIMRPIDTDEIRADIDRLEAEKREIDDELDEIERLERELPDLETRRTSLGETIERREEELADLEARLEDLDTDPTAAEEEDDQQADEDIEATFAELRRARAALDDVKFDLETARETRRELAAEREDLADEREAVERKLDELHEDDSTPTTELAGRLSELRERKRALDATVSELQSVIRFNEQRLEEGGIDLADGNEPADGSSGRADGGALTDKLVADEEAITCWTCGTEVARERIEETLDRLQTLHRDRLDERASVTERIDDLSSRKKDVEERERRLERIDSRIAEIDEELDAQAARIDDLEADREEQADRVEELEAATEDFETTDDDDVEATVELHREVTQIELELENHRDELETVEERVADIEARLDERDDLTDRRDAITDELTDLRTRVDRIEADAVEAFNDHMDSILGILEYANIDRIWIERREEDVREGRRTVSQSVFDLHVVRTADDGATYEDTVDHLSESEREVTGLVFALAGFLVHDVHESIPFMLLDSLEAIDSERIADLVDYFEKYVDCLVVALLPEDAQALSGEYAYHTDI